MLSTPHDASSQKLKLLRSTHLPHYPSASAMEWYQGRLYLMGDDAPGLLQLNKKHRKPQQVPVFASTQRRLLPAEKPDIEAAVIYKGKSKNLLLLPSFSASHRNKIVWVPLEQTKGTASLLDSPLPVGTGLEQLNIEGATQAGEWLLLANRGHLGAPQNHLLLAHFDTATGTIATAKTMLFRLRQTSHFAGVSGLHYVAAKDLLLFTASIELTTSPLADGAIGDSFLGVVHHFSRQLQHQEIVADTLINLTPVLDRSAPQKIESITVESVKGNKLVVHLASDNDNGQSRLFRLRMKL